MTTASVSLEGSPSAPRPVPAGGRPSIYLETYGCQMNVADSELILGTLASRGYTATTDADQADVILLNTCAIREHAEERVAQRVRQFIALRRGGKAVRIGLAGCMAQHHRESLLERIPGLDFIVGPDGYRRLPDLLEADAPVAAVRLDRRETYDDIEPVRGAGMRAWLTIMRGCDRFCTFCVVPFVRGRERSLPAPVLIEELRRIAAQGYKEVVLLGQTVNAYRHDGVDFGALLRMACEVDGIERIRFTSPHPADFTDSAIAAMAECPKLPAHMHLPLQSGSDALLAAMQRGHTIEEFHALARRLRATIPKLALSTDIIVGYPGETEEDFEATSSIMEEIGFDHAYLFKYSPREGTRSFKLDETVSEKEKGRRLERLIREQQARALRYHQAMIGTVTEVLVEGVPKRQQHWLSGKDPQYRTVCFEPTDARPGDVVPVLVEAVTFHTLSGRQVALSLMFVRTLVAHPFRSATIALLLALGAGLLGFGATLEGLKAVTRYTGRLGFFSFALVFCLSPWHRTRPSELTRLALRNRRGLGLAFAYIHTVHLGFIFAYLHASGTPLSPGRVAGGAVGYVLLYVMVATSSDAAVRRLGAANWRRLHSGCLYYLWIVFLLTYLPRLLGKVPTMGAGPVEVVACLWLLLAMAALRVTARMATRTAAPVLKSSI